MAAEGPLRPTRQLRRGVGAPRGGRVGGERGPSCQGLRHRSPPNRPHAGGCSGGGGRETTPLKCLGVSLPSDASPAVTAAASLKLCVI